MLFRLILWIIRPHHAMTPIHKVARNEYENTET